jgi:hypothetical protein
MSKFMRKLEIQPLIRFGGMAAAILSAGIVLATGTTLRADEHHEFNEKGNIVIADQFNNRVVEIDPETHKVVWQFGDGADKPGPNSIVGTNDAERVGEFPAPASRAVSLRLFPAARTLSTAARTIALSS